MEEKPNPDQQTVREQLNEIGEYWANHGKYPDGSSEADVRALSRALFDQLEELIETYVSNSTLHRHEAEVRALTRFIDEDNNLLTKEAVTLLFTTAGTEFGNATESDDDASTSQRITTEEVQRHYLTANEKINAAKQTIRADTIPDPDAVHASPVIVWLDQDTVNRLRDQHEPGETTFDDTLTRILDETETSRSLDEFARRYLTARGQDNVAQLAIEQQSFESGTLVITAHTGVQDELPDIVTETDAITLQGQRYNFLFHEDPHGPHTYNRITLYASDTITGMDGVTLKDGVAAANTYISELLEHGDSPPVEL